MRNRTIIKTSLALAVLGCSPLVQAAGVATPVTFAQVIESSANANANVFSYLNNGAGSDAELGTDVNGKFGVAVPVDFTFLSIAGSLPADLQGVQGATVTLTSSSISPVTTAFAGMVGSQPITGGGTAFNILKITRSTPAGEGSGNKTNLLTMIFTGNLMGAIGGQTPQLSGNSSLGDTVTYTSDFVTFAQTTEQNFALGFSSWGPVNPPPPGLSIASDNYFNTASAAGIGTFDFQGVAGVIPEPTSTGALCAAGLLLAANGRRARSLLNPRRGSAI